MADVLIHSDSMSGPDMRHSVPVAIPDAFLFAEHGDRRELGPVGGHHPGGDGSGADDRGPMGRVDG